MKLDGEWLAKGLAPWPDRMHFVPAGLPVALCGVQTGSRRESIGGRCSECFSARTRIESEMAREAAQQPTPRPGGESEL